MSRRAPTRSKSSCPDSAPQTSNVTVSVGAAVSVDNKLEAGGSGGDRQRHGRSAGGQHLQRRSVDDGAARSRFATSRSSRGIPYDLVDARGKRPGSAEGTDRQRRRRAAPATASTASAPRAPTSCSTARPTTTSSTRTVGQEVPLDSVQEFSVITNNFSAQYGRATGGIVNVITKSGTNTFRGTGLRVLPQREAGDQHARQQGQRHREGRVQAQPAGLQHRRPDREGQDALLLEPRVHRRAQHRHADLLGADAAVPRREQPGDPRVLRRLRQGRQRSTARR